MRRRPYALLAHLAASGALHHAEIPKGDITALRERLALWRIDLVITSGCPLVPMAALEGWRRTMRWKAGRFVKADAARPVDDGHWERVRGPLSVGLRRARQTLWFRPVPGRIR